MKTIKCTLLQENISIPTAPLIALDATASGFCLDLEALDFMSSRTCDTVHVFYVRAGQKTPGEILANVVCFYQFYLYSRSKQKY